MIWLERLKKAEVPPAALTTEPTKPGFVGSVGTTPGHFQISAQGVHSVRAGAGPHDVDQHCWPHSLAMNTFEIDVFFRRVSRFMDTGISEAEAEQVADGLVGRDRDLDDRRTCLECRHLRGHGHWRCANWRLHPGANGHSERSIVGDNIRTLQRCEGFVLWASDIKIPNDFGEMG